MSLFGKGVLRVAKNYTKGYSDIQAKVREATSNDAWGPSGTQMNEIAQMTYYPNDFVEIMEMLDKRLNDKGKNWRHVFKSLTLLDYLLYAGSENVVIYFRVNIYIIKTLKEFYYLDESGKDQGANVRQKAKDITNLLTDEARLRRERSERANMRDRMLGRPVQEEGNDGSLVPLGDSSRAKVAEGDDNLRRALEESLRKRPLGAEQARGVKVADLARFSTASPLQQISSSPLERLALCIEDLITSTTGTLAPDTIETLTSWPKLGRRLIQADIPTDPVDVYAAPRD